MFIPNTVTFRPSTFSAKNRWSITIRWWQVYRTTGFRCYVFPLPICRDLSSRTDACADVKYTHTHTHMNTNNDTHTSWKCICISNDNLNTGPLCYGGEGTGVKTIDFSFAHQRRKTSCYIIRMMDKIIIQNYDIYPLKTGQVPGTVKRHYKTLRCNED